MYPCHLLQHCGAPRPAAGRRGRDPEACRETAAYHHGCGGGVKVLVVWAAHDHDEVPQRDAAGVLEVAVHASCEDAASGTVEDLLAAERYDAVAAETVAIEIAATATVVAAG